MWTIATVLTVGCLAVLVFKAGELPLEIRVALTLWVATNIMIGAVVGKLHDLWKQGGGK